jgi:hypothetical protein
MFRSPRELQVTPIRWNCTPMGKMVMYSMKGLEQFMEERTEERR